MLAPLLSSDRWFRRCSAPGLLLLGYLAASLPARAGNDDEIFVGNQAAMTGGAVSATVSDSSATWYNPAGLGAVGLDEIDVSGTCYTLRSYSAPRFITSVDGQADSASVVEFVSVPAQIAYVRRLGPGLSLGLGYFVPQASSFVLRESLQLQSDGREAAWQVGLNEVHVQHTGAIGVGMQLARAVRVGFSLLGTYQSQTQSLSVVALQGQADEPEMLREHFASSALLGTASEIGLEAGVGFQIEVAPAVRLAASARSARLLVYQLLHVSGARGVASSAAAGMPGRIAAQLADPSVQRSRFDVIRAGRLNLAVAWLGKGGDWASAEIDVQPAIDAVSAGVERRVVVNARVGVYHRWSDSMAIGAGLFSDRSPDPGSNQALSGSGDFYGGSLGWQHDSQHRLGPGEHSDTLSFSTTLALRYAFSRGRLNDLFVDPSAPEQLDSERGPLLVHELGLYVGGGLSF